MFHGFSMSFPGFLWDGWLIHLNASPPRTEKGGREAAGSASDSGGGKGLKS